MTHRERVGAALNRQAVDRVPIMEMGIDWAVVRGLGYRRYLELIEGLDLDGVVVNQELYYFGWRRWVIPHVTHYVDEWRVKSRFTGELLPIPVGHPIASMDDLADYTPPDPARNPLLRLIRSVRRRVPGRAIGILSRNDFAASWFLCGMDRLLMSYIDEPDLADALGEMVSDYYVRLFKLAVEAGADVIYLTDDYAYKSGTLMSREHFGRFILPWLSRGVEAVHAAGGLCVKHTDGDISGVMDLIVGTGVDAVGPLEPAAGNNLRDIQREWGDTIAVVGNIDVDLLSRGEASEVAEETRGLVRDLGVKGGHVLSSGNTVTSSVRPENFKAMIDAAREPEP